MVKNSSPFQIKMVNNSQPFQSKIENNSHPFQKASIKGKLEDLYSIFKTIQNIVQICANMPFVQVDLVTSGPLCDVA